MKSHTTESFRNALALLPSTIQKRARASYRRFRLNPQHAGLQFKKVHTTKPVYSARINDDYRAVGMMDGNDIIWFWIGKHEEYERLLRQL
jgi:hypothetical protein